MQVWLWPERLMHCALVQEQFLCSFESIQHGRMNREDQTCLREVCELHSMPHRVCLCRWAWMRSISHFNVSNMVFGRGGELYWPSRWFWQEEWANEENGTRDQLNAQRKSPLKLATVCEVGAIRHKTCQEIWKPDQNTMKTDHQTSWLQWTNFRLIQRNKSNQDAHCKPHDESRYDEHCRSAPLSACSCYESATAGSIIRG